MGALRGIVRGASGLLADARRARRESGVSLAEQFRQIQMLRAHALHFGLSDYYFYRLYRPQFSDAQRAEFIGWRGDHKMDAMLNHPGLEHVTHDKVLYADLMAGIGAPTPEILALIGGMRRNTGGTRYLADVEALAAFIDEYFREADKPGIFIKPVAGSFGKGALAITGCADGGTMLALANGKRLETRRLQPLLEFAAYRGLMAQKFLRPHSSIGEITAAKLASVRFTILRLGDRFIPLRATLRIPVGNTMVDNYSGGRTGNLIAAIDVDTGGIWRVVSGQKFDVRECSTHPDTGRPLTGFVLPDWERAVSAMMAAASHLPDMRFQHWDIAFTDQGPLLLEVNTGGGLNLHQLAHDRGLYTEELCTAIAEYAASSETIERLMVAERPTITDADMQAAP